MGFLWVDDDDDEAREVEATEEGDPSPDAFFSVALSRWHSDEKKIAWMVRVKYLGKEAQRNMLVNTVR